MSRLQPSPRPALQNLLTLEPFGQTVDVSGRLPFQVGYANITPNVSNGTVQATRTIRSVVEENFINDPEASFPLAVLPIVRRALIDRGISFVGGPGQVQQIAPVELNALPPGTLRAVQTTRHLTIEFQNENIQSRFVAKLLMSFPLAEVAVLCASRLECLRQAKLLAEFTWPQPMSLDIDPEREGENEQRFSIVQRNTPSGVLVQTSPRLVVGTPDGLEKHMWGNVSTKTFVLVTDVRLFGQKPFVDYTLALPLDQSRVYFLDTKRSIWTGAFTGRILCGVGADRLLMNDKMEIVQYPVIRSVNLKWQLPKRRLRDIVDMLAALDRSSHRVRLVVRELATIAAEKRSYDIVVVTPSRACAEAIRSQIYKNQDLTGRTVTLTTEDFSDFRPTKATVICWTGARRAIHLLLESFVRERRDSQPIDWVDFADHPIKSYGVMPPAAEELFQATRHRMGAYREYGFVPNDLGAADYFLDSAEREIIHA